MHTHAHSHADHAPRPTNWNRAFAWGVGLNVAFVVVETAFGVFSNSLALLADAGHNLSDVLGLLMAWGAHLLAGRAPTARRTYGLRRGTILASLGSAILLLVALGGITWEAIGRFRHPGEVAATTVIVVAAIGVGINTATALLFLRGKDHDLNLRGAFLHMAADAAISLGVILGGVAILYTGKAWIDPALSLGIAAVIFWGTWGLLRESLGLAFDGVPANIDPTAVREYLGRLPGVCAVHDLHIWAMSTTETALTAHLVVPEGEADDPFLHRVAEELDHRFGIQHTTIQVERGTHEADCPAGGDRL